MKHNGTPILDPRDAAQVLDELLARRPAYVSGWLPAESGPSQAIIQVFARYLQALAERLNQAPDKNKLAFLDLLGINLLPAQAARAPVVFEMIPNAGDSRAPAQTRLGAQVPGRSDPLIFETEDAIGLAGAKLAEVVALWPGRDAYADHSMTAIGGQPFTLFQPLQPVPHELYLAHDTHFALAGQSTVEIEFELASVGSSELKIVWEYWDGKVWRDFKDFKPPAEATESDSLDGTQGLTRSGVVRLVADCAKTEKTKIDGIEAHWIRGRLDLPLPQGPGQVLPAVDRIQVRTVIERRLTPYYDIESGLVDCIGDTIRLDRAFANGLQLDVSKTFYPFGQQPQPGSTFYFSNQEIFSKPEATMKVCVMVAPPRDRRSGETDLPSPEVVWEYWNGNRWTPVATEIVSPSSPPPLQDPTRFKGNGLFTIKVPSKMTPVEVNSQLGLWMRARLRSGAYGFQREISYQGPPEDPGPFRFTMAETIPPALADMRLGYTYRSPQAPPQQCLTYNDFQWEDHTQDARWRGTTFAPFRPVDDTTPTLYLGFDRALPADLISLYLDIQEVAGQSEGPPLKWEYWDGTAWLPLSVQDETANLALPGMVRAVWPGTPAPPTAAVIQATGTRVQLADARDAARFQPGDQVYIRQDGTGELATVNAVEDNVLTVKVALRQSYSGGRVGLAGLPRFGTPHTWIRARRQDGGPPLQSLVNGVYLNATWAAQIQTVSDEVLGSSNAQPNQSFFFRQTPVLEGEVIEVRELEGPRAAVELPMLREELLQQGLTDADIRTVTDRRTGRVNQVWVRWQARPNLFFSGPDDRHYVIERSRGRLIFGDNEHGRIPPAGADNIRARRYRSGGGLAGNVPAGVISQLLGAVPLAQGLTNPRAAEGGADGELVEAVLTRGPRTIRHRRQALSLADYEALAREASPTVAVARALPATHPSGRPAPGWVKVIIMPQSQDPQPQPSFELRRQVQQFLAARAPAAMADQITVTGPDYLPIGVEAVVAPVNPEEAGPVGERVRQALASFLHPLTGGPEGQGWPFGRDVYLSDVAAVLEAVEGVDYVETINLLLDGTPRGERIDVPPDRIVVAGPLRITLKGSER